MDPQEKARQASENAALEAFHKKWLARGGSGGGGIQADMQDDEGNIAVADSQVGGGKSFGLPLVAAQKLEGPKRKMAPALYYGPQPARYREMAKPYQGPPPVRYREQSEPYQNPLLAMLGR